jgi:tetratricopeptide (TPR) repeat protein
MLVGDVNRGIDVGEAALREAGWGKEPASESVIELASTLGYCYYERGDLSRAQYLMTKVLTRAEEHGSVRARASAYWNAAYIAQGNGDVRAAVALTERALALFGELENAWATATLRRNAGWLLLQLPEPPLHEIRPLLERALAELQEVGSPQEIAEVEIDLAQLHLDLGDEAVALQFAKLAVDRTCDGPMPEAARARLMLADVLVAGQDTTRALAMYRDAAMDFEAASVTRLAALSWRRLADLLVSLGRHEEAIDAYARLADVIGVPHVSPASQRVRHRNFGY